MHTKLTTQQYIFRIMGSLALLAYLTFPLEAINALKKEITLESITVLLLFVVFLAGYYFLWKNEIIAGTILVIWHVIQWFLVEFVWADGGMTILPGVPLAVFGIWVLTYGLKKEKPSFFHPLKQKRLVMLIPISLYYGIEVWIVLITICLIFVITGSDAIDVWSKLTWLKLLIGVPLLVLFVLTTVNISERYLEK